MPNKLFSVQPPSPSTGNIPTQLLLRVDTVGAPGDVDYVNSQDPPNPLRFPRPKVYQIVGQATRRTTMPIRVVSIMLKKDLLELYSSKWLRPLLQRRFLSTHLTKIKGSSRYVWIWDSHTYRSSSCCSRKPVGLPGRAQGEPTLYSPLMGQMGLVELQRKRGRCIILQDFFGWLNQFLQRAPSTFRQQMTPPSEKTHLWYSLPGSKETRSSAHLCFPHICKQVPGFHCIWHIGRLLTYLE